MSEEPQFEPPGESLAGRLKNWFDNNPTVALLRVAAWIVVSVLGILVAVHEDVGKLFTGSEKSTSSSVTPPAVSAPSAQRVIVPSCSEAELLGDYTCKGQPGCTDKKEISHLGEENGRLRWRDGEGKGANAIFHAGEQKLTIVFDGESEVFQVPIEENCKALNFRGTRDRQCVYDVTHECVPLSVISH